MSNKFSFPFPASFPPFLSPAAALCVRPSSLSPSERGREREEDPIPDFSRDACERERERKGEGKRSERVSFSFRSSSASAVACVNDSPLLFLSSLSLSPPLDLISRSAIMGKRTAAEQRRVREREREERRASCVGGKRRRGFLRLTTHVNPLLEEGNEQTRSGLMSAREAEMKIILPSYHSSISVEKAAQEQDDDEDDGTSCPAIVIVSETRFPGLASRVSLTHTHTQRQTLIASHASEHLSSERDARATQQRRQQEQLALH